MIKTKQTATQTRFAKRVNALVEVIDELGNPFCDTGSELFRQGYKKVTIYTVDTDVVKLAISVVPKIDVLELWIAFGTGKHFQRIPPYTVALCMGPKKALALLCSTHSQDATQCLRSSSEARKQPGAHGMH